MKLLRKRSTVDSEGKVVEVVIKNIKSKHLPTNLRAKKTRAMRRALTKAQSRKLSVKLLKRKLNFPARKYAVPL